MGLVLLLAVGALAILGMVGFGIWAGLNAPRVYDTAGVTPNAAAAPSDDPAAARDFAWSLIDAGSAGAAIAAARHAVELDPVNAESHLVLGAALQGSGRPEDAEAALNEAMRLDPDNAYVHYYLAGGYNSEYRWEESEAHARRTVALDPTIARAHGLLATALSRRFAWQEAYGSRGTDLRSE